MGGCGDRVQPQISPSPFGDVPRSQRGRWDGIQTQGMPRIVVPVRLFPNLTPRLPLATFRAHSRLASLSPPDTQMLVFRAPGLRYRLLFRTLILHSEATKMNRGRGQKRSQALPSKLLLWDGTMWPNPLTKILPARGFQARVPIKAPKQLARVRWEF